MDRRISLLQTAAAIGALVVGVVVYLIDRHPASVYFIPDWITLANNFSPIFGEIGNYLPTFIHVYVFILLTAVVVAASPTRIILICASWFAIDGLFEIAQIVPIAQRIGGQAPSWFSGLPFLENTSTYFQAGTFDILGLVSITMGTIAAYLTIKRGIQEREHYVPGI